MTNNQWEPKKNDVVALTQWIARSQPGTIGVVIRVNTKKRTGAVEVYKRNMVVTLRNVPVLKLRVATEEEAAVEAVFLFQDDQSIGIKVAAANNVMELFIQFLMTQLRTGEVTDESISMIVDDTHTPLLHAAVADEFFQLFAKKTGLPVYEKYQQLQGGAK